MALQQLSDIRNTTQSHQVAWRLLLTVHAHAYRQIDDELQKSGLLTFNDYDVLLTLNEAPKETLRMSELAEAVLLSNSGMSRRVTTLVNSGLVTRTQSRNDGRVFWVKLTAKGRKAIISTWETYKPLIDDVFSQHLTEEEADTMAQLLQKILNGTGLQQHRDLLKNKMTDAPKPKPKA
ncbi:MarR family winged helix-turn-helix transcriptional regulator [Luteolibacter sp. AS25]|uniref:MarR family winged helix-turn-helix transcriptional regulator n=1 Tax=Luteolibacter sp. AS25 TaxID=3135776 RepID=UPI00398B1440